jgi:soluble lytic murein transglycosylase-like protein
MAESGGNPAADNTGLNQDGTNDKGLMQINSIHVTSGLIGDQERFDPTANLRAAYAIYQGGGWGAWSSYNAGKHLRFM